jgi:cilia- and flagella-associated protein 57
LITPFHRQEVTGLDVCIRKQLIATCSKDKFINIWNIKDRCQEIEPHLAAEECFAIAFHPSGLHLIVAVGTDKLVLYNLSGGRLRQQEKQFSAKNCLDIKFSNGGHLFAAVNRNDVDVYNFYTHECPESMKFSQNHNKSINCIDWFDNDMGFTSCGADGYIYFVDLYTGRLGEKRNMQHSHNEKNA